MKENIFVLELKSKFCVEQLKKQTISQFITTLRLGFEFEKSMI